MKHNLLRSRLGFTLAEVLAVIGIIVIMMSLGVPGFLGIRKSLQITAYDDVAREIYIAAQNQLTRLSVGGMDTTTETTLKTGTSMGENAPKDYIESDDGTWDKDAYLYVSSKDDTNKITDILLPFGSVTDDARNGHYVIEYNVETYVVYGVFYSEDEFKYSTVSTTTNFRKDKSVRKSQSPMVGYYGGSAVERDKQNYCKTPN